MSALFSKKAKDKNKKTLSPKSKVVMEETKQDISFSPVQESVITGFYVRIRAETGQSNPGPGAHSAIKSLTRAGFKIISIMDNTKMPRGGPKGPHGRRGRRV